MNESINLKIGMEVSQGGLFGITVAIFEFPPQSQVMGQNVVTWPPLYEPPKSTKNFFSFFHFFWWNMTFGYLNRTKNINSNFHCHFFTSFRVFELHFLIFWAIYFKFVFGAIHFKDPKGGNKLTVKIIFEVFCTI